MARKKERTIFEVFNQGGQAYFIPGTHRFRTGPGLCICLSTFGHAFRQKPQTKRLQKIAGVSCEKIDGILAKRSDSEHIGEQYRQADPIKFDPEYQSTDTA